MLAGSDQVTEQPRIEFKDEVVNSARRRSIDAHIAARRRSLQHSDGLEGHAFSDERSGIGARRRAHSSDSKDEQGFSGARRRSNSSDSRDGVGRYAPSDLQRGIGARHRAHSGSKDRFGGYAASTDQPGIAPRVQSTTSSNSSEGFSRRIDSGGALRLCSSWAEDPYTRPSLVLPEGVRELEQIVKAVLPELRDYLQRDDVPASSDAAVDHVRLCLQSAEPMLQQVLMTIRALAGEISLIPETIDESPERKESGDSFMYDTVCSGPSNPDITCPENAGTTENNSSRKPRRLSMSKQLPRRFEVDAGSRRFSFSTAMEMDEQGRYVTSRDNRCYIHPERPFKMAWDIMSMALIVGVMIFVPLEIAFFFDDTAVTPLSFDAFSTIVDTFFAIDIFLNFFVAVHEGVGVSAKLINDNKGMALSYVKSWFLLDVLATFPYSLVTSGEGFSATMDKTASHTKMARVIRFAKVAKVMKVLRILKLRGLMQVLEEKLIAAKSMTVGFQLTKLMIWMMLVSHNVACIWFLLSQVYDTSTNNDTTWLQVNGLDNAAMTDQWIAAFYFAITTGTTVGYGGIHPENWLEQLANSLIMVFFICYVGPLISSMAALVASLRETSNQLAATKRDTLVFLLHRDVPKELVYKVLRYIDYVFEEAPSAALDPLVLGNLSKSLQAELAMAIIGNTLKQFPLFNSDNPQNPADANFVSRLCQVCASRRHGEGDLVVREDEIAKAMYFVVTGDVFVIRNSKPLFTLKGGDWFGELTLFFPGSIRAASVFCETASEFLVLTYDSLQEVLAEFPLVKEQYQKLCEQLKKGDMKALGLKCNLCGAADHLMRDCPKNRFIAGDEKDQPLPRPMDPPQSLRPSGLDFVATGDALVEARRQLAEQASPAGHSGDDAENAGELNREISIATISSIRHDDRHDDSGDLSPFSKARAKVQSRMARMAEHEPEIPRQASHPDSELSSI